MRNLGGQEITTETFEQYEGNQNTAGDKSDYLIDDILYVNATAWRSTTYAQVQWPYQSSIETSYFRATIAKIMNHGAKIKLSFDAFDLGDESSSYRKPWFRRYTTKELPEGSTIISKEMYEEHEDSYRNKEEESDCKEGTTEHTYRNF